MGGTCVRVSHSENGTTYVWFKFSKVPLTNTRPSTSLWQLPPKQEAAKQGRYHLACYGTTHKGCVYHICGVVFRMTNTQGGTSLTTHFCFNFGEVLDPQKPHVGCTRPRWSQKWTKICKFQKWTHMAAYYDFEWYVHVRVGVKTIVRHGLYFEALDINDFGSSFFFSGTVWNEPWIENARHPTQRHRRRRENGRLRPPDRRGGRGE
jgi:hypothetical protein